MKPRDTLTATTLRLAREGEGVSEIARALGTSVANVSQTLHRYGMKRLVVAALPENLNKWLTTEAAKSGVAPGVMARAMLVDAIEEEMSKCK